MGWLRRVLEWSGEVESGEMPINLPIKEVLGGPVRGALEHVMIKPSGSLAITRRASGSKWGLTFIKYKTPDLRDMEAMIWWRAGQFAHCLSHVSPFLCERKMALKQSSHGMRCGWQTRKAPRICVQ